MNNTVKTFPVRMSEDFHKAVKEVAEKEGKSIHQFIIDSVASKINQTKK